MHVHVILKKMMMTMIMAAAFSMLYGTATTRGEDCFISCEYFRTPSGLLDILQVYNYTRLPLIRGLVAVTDLSAKRSRLSSKQGSLRASVVSS